MSIYATMWTTSDDDHTTGCEDGPCCAKWVRARKGSQAYENARLRKFNGERWNLNDSKPCTCGAGVLPYMGSHVLPGEEDANGYAEVASIPGHIERVGREAEKPVDDETPWPFIRMSIGSDSGHAAVVLTEQHVRNLCEALTWWLEARSEAS
jgi:hypothetical protein